MVSKVGEKETCAALDERWGKDGNNFVAALLDDVGRGRVLRSASAEVALRNEDIQTGGLHPLNNVHAEILEMKSSLKLCQIGNATEKQERIFHICYFLSNLKKDNAKYNFMVSFSHNILMIVYSTKSS